MQDEIKLDWSFRLSLLTDLVRVSNSGFRSPNADLTAARPLSRESSLFVCKGYEVSPWHADTSTRLSHLA